MKDVLLKTGEKIGVRISHFQVTSYKGPMESTVKHYTKYATTFPGSDDGIVPVELNRDENNEWVESMNPVNNGSVEQMENLREAIEEAGL
jgi:hypothetical protein